MKKMLFIICAILLTLSFAVITKAATRTVNTLSNSVTVGSLPYWIINSNAGDTIVFQPGLRGTIPNVGFLINKNLTIHGPGANVLGVDGGGGIQVFRITAGNVIISGLRISNGFVSGAGGGVQVDGGNLTLNNCLISGNIAESAGGVVVFTGSSLTINNSTIAGNESFVEGGGVSNRGGTLTLTNSTILGNIAPDGGGVSVEGGGTATILNCTITGNGNAGGSSGEIGGLRVVSGSTVNLKNTIVAENIVSGTSIADVGGTVNSQGNNLIGNNNGAVGSFPAGNPNANQDIVGTSASPINPLLGGLFSNGGTTQTRALLAGSPAIDAGNNTGAPTTDQRGAARPVGAAVDIGAFESGVPITSTNTFTGSNVNTSLGAVSITFSGVSTAGTTMQIPIDPASAGTLPGGYSFGAGYPAYEITTTANYTAPIVVCLQVPGVTNPTTFAGLRIMHYEGGTLADKTILPPDSPAPDFATKTICARVNSLSPFVVANAAPTAASVSVGGRIVDSNGNGISRVSVSITNQNGETRYAITNPFGFYRFDEIPVGETYVIAASHKRHQFNSQVIVVLEDIQTADFTAEP